MPTEPRSSPATLRIRRAAGVFVALLAVSSSSSTSSAASAQVLGERYVTQADGRGRFALFAGGRAAPLHVDSADWPGVIRAAGDLRADLGRVTGAAPDLSVGGSLGGGIARRVVIIGTIGKSATIDGLVRAGKLDVRGVAGRWETFVIQTVDRPMPGVEQALVIAGSDRRGAIFGIYDLSAQIGVSPWYWWADVPVQRQTALYVTPGRHTRGEPAVRYRGIFINDEAPALSGWAGATFGGFNHRFYEKVFELILRLKGNYLWPAMWGSAFYADDSLDARTADLYGVVIGTSHHEPMLRAHDEWRRSGSGPWDYTSNDSALRAFWREGARRVGVNESVATVGMRGDGDEPMTQGTATALLERIVADQRRILGEVTGRDPSTIPQVWALYKEVQDYYDAGMRVPPDVTLLFSDDNWGNLRRLPTAADRGRPGGFGVYYHFDYVGGPRNYKWLNTTQIARVWEQMRLASQTGATRLWIVNVGDIKPMEQPISFFLDYAWNPSAIPADRIPAWRRAWAAQQFGAGPAEPVARVLGEYERLASQRKPELRDTATFSASYDEAARNAAAWSRLEGDAAAIRDGLGAGYRDAYDQLVLHPVRALANLDALYHVVALDRLHARQGRASANGLADSARRLFARDAELTRWYNERIAGGRWNHMMDQTHIGYTYWQEPPRNQMPRVDLIQVPAAAELGVTTDEAGRWWPASRDSSVLTFSRYGDVRRVITVFNRGSTPFEWSITAGVPWLKLAVPAGRVVTEREAVVEVDWSRAPAGTTRVPITITGAGRTVVVTAVVENPAGPPPRGFVEADGVVAMEAEHFDRAVRAHGLSWIRIPELGRTLSAMTPSSAIAPSQAPGAGPRLEYVVHLEKAGEVAVHAYLSPSLDFRGGTGLRYAVSIDDEAPRVVNMHADGSARAGDSNRAWEQMVANNVNVSVSHHMIAAAGEHVLKFWMIDPGVVLQRIVVDAGGLKPSYLGPPESWNARLHSLSAPTSLQQPMLALATPAAAQRASGQANDARFDWFEYTGDDPVYRGITPRADEYLNPILSGFYPDPSIERVGDDYYLVTSSFSYFPGVPILQSRDLVNWTQIGHVLDRPSQLNLDSVAISRGIFAPVIRWHAGTFYMITTIVDRGGNFIVTATNPAGPWSDPVFLPEVDGIDPSLFFDDDGRAYVVNNGPPVGPPLYEGHRAIWIQEFDAASKRMVGPRRLIVNGGVDLSKQPIWIEAPHLLKVDGRYYLICAEGGTAEQHSEVVFRADSVRGPYVPAPVNPILTQRHLDPDRPNPITTAGHADFVRTPRGEWWAVFLGVRPYLGNHYNNGRETYLLPVRWTDGWPLILPGSDTVPHLRRGPSLPRTAAAPLPMSGNFTVRDEFTAPTLAPYWVFVRTPRERWHTLAGGALVLRPRAAALGDVTRQPSFVARRQQHAYATASTVVRFAPSHDGDKAGIAAFHDDHHFYLLAVARVNGRRVVQLEARSGGDPATVIASAPVSGSGAAPVYLKIQARGARYDFSYATRPGAWTVLKADADGTILSTKVAGGFVGTMLGMYAYSAAPAR